MYLVEIFSTEQVRLFVKFIFGAVASYVAYLAYRYNQERMRLELFDKGWSVYESALTYMSITLQCGSLKNGEKINFDKQEKERVKEAIDAAHEAFRGTGYHKYQSLFGPDVADFMEELNFIYAKVNVEDRNSLSILEMKFKELPIVFYPYLYFGDYKIKRGSSILRVWEKVIGISSRE